MRVASCLSVCANVAPSDATVAYDVVLHVHEERAQMPDHHVSGCPLFTCAAAGPSDATVEDIPGLHVHKQHFQTRVI